MEYAIDEEQETYEDGLGELGEYGSLSVDF